MRQGIKSDCLCQWFQPTLLTETNRVGLGTRTGFSAVGAYWHCETLALAPDVVICIPIAQLYEYTHIQS